MIRVFLKLNFGYNMENRWLRKEPRGQDQSNELFSMLTKRY